MIAPSESELVSDGNGENPPPAIGDKLPPAINRERLPESGIPQVFEHALTRAYQEKFEHEYNPVGQTEKVLVNELARHAAGMDRWGEGSGAVERQAARHLPNLSIDTTNQDLTSHDAVLASVLTTEAAICCDRRSLMRTRAFLRILEKLEAVQIARKQCELQGHVMPPLGFVDEAACERYLADRLRRGLVPCPKCGDTSGCVIATRKCWECRSCKMQSGLRANTVMTRSPVSLRQWFDAIRLLLWEPTIGAGELAEKLGIERIPTVRTMARKIRGAMAADDVSVRLAGLDQHFSR